MSKSLTRRIGRTAIITCLGLAEIVGFGSGCIGPPPTPPRFNEKTALGIFLKSKVPNAKNPNDAYRLANAGDALIGSGQAEDGRSNQSVIINNGQDNPQYTPRENTPPATAVDEDYIFTYRTFEDNNPKDGVWQLNEFKDRNQQLFYVGDNFGFCFHMNSKRGVIGFKYTDEAGNVLWEGIDYEVPKTSCLIRGPPETMARPGTFYGVWTRDGLPMGKSKIVFVERKQNK